MEPGRIAYELVKEGISGDFTWHDGGTLIGSLKDLGVPIDGVIVISKGVPIPLDHPLEDLESIKIINVLSGG